MMISRLVESNWQPRIDAVRMCRVSKCLRKSKAEQGFQSFPIIKSTLEINGKNWKQEGLKVSNHCHLRSDLARSVREDACSKLRTRKRA
jgi:hypothetical protein